MRKICVMLAIGAVTAIGLPGMASGEVSGVGKAVPIVQAVRGIKKFKEKNETEKAHETIMAKLKERFPKEVEAIEAEAKDHPDTAKQKTEALIKRYKDETGVDLNALKPPQKEGLIRERIHKRIGQIKNQPE